MGQAVAIVGRPIPLSIFSLVINLGEELLLLPIDLVVGNAASLSVLPASNIVPISTDPFWNLSVGVMNLKSKQAYQQRCQCKFEHHGVFHPETSHLRASRTRLRTVF